MNVTILIGQSYTNEPLETKSPEGCTSVWVQVSSCSFKVLSMKVDEDQTYVSTKYDVVVFFLDFPIHNDRSEPPIKPHKFPINLPHPPKKHPVI